jgi:spore maturation protein CgeB
MKIMIYLSMLVKTDFTTKATANTNPFKPVARLSVTLVFSQTAKFVKHLTRRRGEELKNARRRTSFPFLFFFSNLRRMFFLEVTAALGQFLVRKESLLVKRLDVSPRLRARMNYKKLAGETPRMLVLESDYWLDHACFSAAKELGWQVRSARVAAKGVLPRDQIEQLLLALLDFRPDFILSINLSGMDMDGVFAGLFEDLGVPYVTWFVDDPRTIIMNRTTYGSALSVALTWERSYCGYLKDAGFAIAEWLPLAVDPNIFCQPPCHAEGPPAFVGNSMTAPAEEEWAWVNARAELAAAVREALDSGRVTREAFARGLEALLPGPFLEKMDEDERRHAELLMFVEGTRRLRANWARALVQDGMRIYGDEQWREIVPAAGGAVNYRSDLAGLYQSSTVNLNITSIQMATAVNQRVFDCPAAGGFLLTDAQADLGELFAPDEVATYGSIDECRALLAFYQSRPDLRAGIVNRAQARIAAEHAYARRLGEIVKAVEQLPLD